MKLSQNMFVSGKYSFRAIFFSKAEKYDLWGNILSMKYASLRQKYLLRGNTIFGQNLYVESI